MPLYFQNFNPYESSTSLDFHIKRRFVEFSEEEERRGANIMKRLCGGDDTAAVHTKSGGFDSSETEKAAKSLLNEVAKRFQDRPGDYRMFCQCLNDFTNRRVDFEGFGLKIKRLFQGHDDLIVKLNVFLPEGYMLNLKDYDDDNEDDDVDTEDGGGHDQDYVEREREHGDDNRDYCVHNHVDGGKVVAAIRDGVDNYIGGDKVVATVNFMNKVKVRFQNNKQIYEKFLQIINEVQDGQRSHELKYKVAALFHEHSDLFEEFEGIISDSRPNSNSANNDTSTAKTRAKKHEVQSIQELDLSKCKQVSPSYWLLPKNFYSHRSELAAEVLNDRLACVSTNSGNYSFNRRQGQRIQEEEILFQCEDDRFELDMLTEYIFSAAERVGKLMKKIDDNENNGQSSSTEKIEGLLRVSDLRCIQRLYGDYGLDVIEYLHKDPKAALPAIWNRLKQKQEELVKRRPEFNEVWAQVCAQNHYKLRNKQQESNNSRREDLAVAREHLKEIEERTQMQKEDVVSLDSGVFQPAYTSMRED